MTQEHTAVPEFDIIPAPDDQGRVVYVPTSPELIEIQAGALARYNRWHQPCQPQYDGHNGTSLRMRIFTSYATEFGVARAMGLSIGQPRSNDLENYPGDLQLPDQSWIEVKESRWIGPTYKLALNQDDSPPLRGDYYVLTSIHRGPRFLNVSVVGFVARAVFETEGRFVTLKHGRQFCIDQALLTPISVLQEAYECIPGHPSPNAPAERPVP